MNPKPSPTPPPSGAVLGLESAWKNAISSGNTRFSRKEYYQALLAYRRALSHARRLVARPVEWQEKAVPAHPIYLITCANLGNTLVELDQADDAESWFLRALRFASRPHDPRRENDAGTLGSPVSDLRTAVLNYTEFCEHTGRRPDGEILRKAAASASGKLSAPSPEVSRED